MDVKDKSKAPATEVNSAQPSEQGTSFMAFEAAGKEVKSTQPAERGTISFVAFNGSPSDASRKAVRKQAALASAATRKATIAKKAAWQKEQAMQQCGQPEGRTKTLQEIAQQKEQAKQQVRQPEARTNTLQEIAQQKEQAEQQCRQPEERTKTLQETASSKRKRLSEESKKNEVSTAALAPLNATEDVQQKTSRRRVVTAYLSPPPTSTETPREELPQWLLQHDPAVMDAATTILRNAVLPYSYTNSLMPLQHNTWTNLSQGYLQDDEYLPPTPDSLNSPRSLGGGMVDPFNQYPVPYHAVYDRLLHYMLTIFAPRGWPSLKITNTEGLAWEHFMTQHALAEPALFLVRVMFASGDLIRLGVLDPNIVVALRSLAIKAINEALTDKNRSISDGLILAVGRIALTECLYGDKRTADTMHRPAQRRMIDLRGGMAALPFPPLVKRLMRWSDRVMSIQSGTPRLLPDDEEIGHVAYDMKVTVNLLEDWAPREGRALRKKIAIADLIT